MTDRREKVLEAVCGKDLDGNSVRYADVTARIILGDMGNTSLSSGKQKAWVSWSCSPRTNALCSG